ncbi:hypothetical protein V3C99_000091 [Haemonchus contortus]
MNEPKKTQSATAETNTSATAPSVPGPSPPSKPTVPPKRPIPAAKPAATATAKPTSTSKGKRDTSSSSSSSSSDEQGLPPKKGRASGTMLKEFLQQGSRILRLAASKVDQLAPAVTVASSEEKRNCTKSNRSQNRHGAAENGHDHESPRSSRTNDEGYRYCFCIEGTVVGGTNSMEKASDGNSRTAS